MTAMIAQASHTETVKAAKVVPVLKCIFAKQIVRGSARNALKATRAMKKCPRRNAGRIEVMGWKRFGMRMESWAFAERRPRRLKAYIDEISWLM